MSPGLKRMISPQITQNDKMLREIQHNVRRIPRCRFSKKLENTQPDSQAPDS